MIKNFFFALIYASSVHYAYVVYINPTFEYAHYTYLNFSTSSAIAAYFFSVLPLFFYRNIASPSKFIVSLIYVFSYVPIQLTLLFTVPLLPIDLLLLQCSLFVSMSVIFYSSNSKSNISTEKYLYGFKIIDKLMIILTVISIVFVIYYNFSHMRIVSFEDVYSLRSDASSREQSIFGAYLVSWLSYCFISYLYARGVVYKKVTFILLGLIASILLYAATGAKFSILLLPVTWGFYKLWGNGKNFLLKLLLISIIMIFTLVIIVPNEGIGMWMKSIVLVRVFGTTGWVAAKYYEFFGSEGLTYYSHIGIINSFTGIYPYAEISLGQAIGLNYSGSTEANFNAGFWASDGFAAWGAIGILFVTPFVSLMLILINRNMRYFDSRFAVLWLIGYVTALLNLPFTTALISGGGALIILFSYCFAASIKSTIKSK